MQRIAEMVSDGADIIDIGAFSTRPGAEYISENEEIDRLARHMEGARQQFPETIFSVDTFRAGVAQTAVREFGFDMVNDISGGNFDEDMFDIVSTLGVPYVLTHCNKSFECLHEAPEYDNVTVTVFRELAEKLQKLRFMGVNDVIVDPGFGFGKTLKDNYCLIKDLRLFDILHAPVLIGISRKSLITKLLDIKSDDALVATSVLNALCLQNNASILRVHDVKAARQTIKLYNAVNKPNTIPSDD